jgi:hypothetical protein
MIFKDKADYFARKIVLQGCDTNRGTPMPPPGVSGQQPTSLRAKYLLGYQNEVT